MKNVTTILLSILVLSTLSLFGCKGGGGGAAGPASGGGSFSSVDLASTYQTEQMSDINEEVNNDPAYQVEQEDLQALADEEIISQDELKKLDITL